MNTRKVCCYGTALLLILGIPACKKNNREKENCFLVPQSLMLPTFQFRVVDKNTGADLFFSHPPAYALTDFKLQFRDNTGKIDSLAPPHIYETGDNTRFIYNVSLNSKQTDTSYMQIKGLKTDTLISTIAQVAGPCNFYNQVVKVQVNKSSPVAVANDVVLIIKK